MRLNKRFLKDWTEINLDDLPESIKLKYGTIVFKIIT